MREPENLKELIEYFEWNYERMEDDHDVICTFTDGDGFPDLLNDLKRKSAMCEADSNAVLAEVRAEEITKIIHILKYAKRHDITLQHGVDEYYINTIINKLQKISKHFKCDPT